MSARDIASVLALGAAIAGALLAALADEKFGLLAVAGVLVLIVLRGNPPQTDALPGATFYGSGHDGLGGRGAQGRSPDSPVPPPLGP